MNFGVSIKLIQIDRVDRMVTEPHRFEKFDENQDNSLSREEFDRFLRQRSKPALDQLLAARRCLADR